MRIFALSDPHLSFMCDKPMDIFGGNWEGYTEKIKEKWCKKVQNDDVVLVAGDISWAMRLEEVSADLEWLDSLPGKKIIIKGNHEYWWKSISAVRNILPASILALQNDAVKIGDFVFCGTRGWVVPENDKPLSAEDDKIYKREAQRLRLTLTFAKNLAKNNEKIIAMMHYPPLGNSVKDTEFTKIFEEFGITTVVFGHIHGKTHLKPETERNGINYYLTSCDQIDNDPILLFEE